MHADVNEVQRLKYTCIKVHIVCVITEILKACDDTISHCKSRGIPYIIMYNKTVGSKNLVLQTLKYYPIW